jgi:hypothetical protein
MNESDVTKTYELLGHSSVEVRVINTNADKVLYSSMVNSANDLVKVCSKYDGKGNVYRKNHRLIQNYNALLTLPNLPNCGFDRKALNRHQWLCLEMVVLCGVLFQDTN